MQLGADPGQLDAVADLLDRTGRLVDAGVTALAAQTLSAAWAGPDREATLRRLERDVRPAATELGRRLAAAATDIRRHAAAQRAVSRPDALPDRPQWRVLFVNPFGDGEAIVSVGDLTSATHIAILVPGMGATLHSFDALADHAAVLQEAAARRLHRPGESVAVVAWLGYDAPAGLDEPWRAYQVLGTARAEAGGRALREFVDRLGRPDAVITLVGHSYGSLVAVDAAKRHPAVDQVVVLGSPGLGADRIGGLDLDPGTTLFAAAFPADPVARSGWFGRSPTEPRFGAVALDATPAPGEPGADITRAHSSYFEPGSRMLDSIAAVVSAEREDQRGHDGNHHRQEDDGRRHRVTDAPTGRR